MSSAFEMSFVMPCRWRPLKWN